jgi:hypothetical protein
MASARLNSTLDGDATAQFNNNRTFTSVASQLLRDQVLACDTATNNTIRELAQALEESQRAAAGAAHAHVPVLRAHPRPFCASDSFVTRFKRTYRLSTRRTKKVHERKHAERDPRDNDDEAAHYLAQVNMAIDDCGAAFVLNMDETPAALVETPRTAIRPTGQKEAAKITTHANERMLITTFPTITASGHKLPMCVILKGTTERCLAKVRSEANATVRKVKLFYSETGWINQGIMLRWLKEVVHPYTNGRHAAIILDDYAAHWTPPVQVAAARLNIDLISVPNFKGATALLQPLDVQYNGLLKVRRSTLWALQRSRDRDSVDSYQAAVERIQLAYDAMTEAVGREAFVKSGIQL